MVLPFEYWPSLNWMKRFLNGTNVQLEQWGTYQKQSLANRCKIAGNQGVIVLSVPLIGGREQKAFLKDVQIDNTQRWAVEHLRTIKSCYGKAPFFEHYFPAIEKIVLQKKGRLIELDEAILLHLLQWLKIKRDIQLTGSFNGQQNQQLKNDCNERPYLQVFSDKQPFLPNLSVLDALLCLGPAVSEYLQP